MRHLFFFLLLAACGCRSQSTPAVSAPSVALAASAASAAPAAPPAVDPKKLVDRIAAQLGALPPRPLVPDLDAVLAAMKRGDVTGAKSALAAYDGADLLVATLTAIAAGTGRRAALAGPLLERFRPPAAMGSWGTYSLRLLSDLAVAAEPVLGEEGLAPFLRGPGGSVLAAEIACAKAEARDFAAAAQYLARVDRLYRDSKTRAAGCLALARGHAAGEADFETALAAAAKPPFISQGGDRSGDEEASALADLVALLARGRGRIAGLAGDHPWVRRAGEALLGFKWRCRAFAWAFGKAKGPAAERGRRDGAWGRLAADLELPGRAEKAAWTEAECRRKLDDCPTARVLELGLLEAAGKAAERPRRDSFVASLSAARLSDLAAEVKARSGLEAALPWIARTLRARRAADSTPYLDPRELDLVDAEALLEAGRGAQALALLSRAQVLEVRRHFDDLERALAASDAPARAPTIERLVSRAVSESWFGWGLGPPFREEPDPAQGCAVVRLTRIVRTLGPERGRELVARLERRSGAEKHYAAEALAAVRAEWSLALSGPARRSAFDSALAAARKGENSFRLEEALRRVAVSAAQVLGGAELAAVFAAPAERRSVALYRELARAGRAADALALASSLAVEEQSRALQAALEASSEPAAVAALAGALDGLVLSGVRSAGDWLAGNTEAYHDGARGQARLRRGDVAGALRLLAKIPFAHATARSELACAIGRALAAEPARADIESLQHLQRIVEAFLPQEVREQVLCLTPLLMPLLPASVRGGFFEPWWRRLGTLARPEAPLHAAAALGLRRAGNQAGADAALERALRSALEGGLTRDEVPRFLDLALPATEAAPPRLAARARVLAALATGDAPPVPTRRAAAQASRWCMEHGDHTSIPALLDDPALRRRPAVRREVLAAWMQEALRHSKAPVSDLAAVAGVLDDEAQVVRARARLVRAALWREKRFEEAARLPIRR